MLEFKTYISNVWKSWRSKNRYIKNSRCQYLRRKRRLNKIVSTANVTLNSTEFLADHISDSKKESLVRKSTNKHDLYTIDVV